MRFSCSEASARAGTGTNFARTAPRCQCGEEQPPLLALLSKCEPRLAEALREEHAAVIPGYHLNKKHWNTVILDGSLTEEVVREMIEDPMTS